MNTSNQLTCCLCNSPLSSPIMRVLNTHGRHLLSHEEFPLYLCSSCGTYQIPIHQDDEYYSKYYNSFDYYHQQRKRTFSTFLIHLFDTINFHLRISAVPFPQKGQSLIRWLDVGAGDGNFLQKLSKKRFEPIGVEISQNGYEEIQKKNIPCFHEDFLSLEFKEKNFDIISFWHVLEHCNNPKAYLQKACDLLGDNGFLIIALPWAESLGFTIGKENWFHLDIPRHVWLPTKHTIDTLMENLPLSLLKSFSPWWKYPLDLWWSLKQSSFFTKWFFRILYPFMKIYDKETVIFLFQKTNSQTEITHA